MWATAHKRPFTLATSRMRGMSPAQLFDAANWRRLQQVAARKVKPLVWLLKCARALGGGGAGLFFPGQGQREGGHAGTPAPGGREVVGGLFLGEAGAALPSAPTPP